MNTQTLSERMKKYEFHETKRKFIPHLPIYTRIDGRCFHSFTRTMNRPYDEYMIHTMVDTTKYLVKETGALVGYTQSDEISLVFFNEYNPKTSSEMLFDGKIFKLTSNIASIATASFLKIALNYFPMLVEKHLPTFDCRVLQFPNKEECVNMIRWRVKDAIKNSVSMLAQSFYSHNALLKVNTEDKLKLLSEKGINWEDYPSSFKEGTFIRKECILTTLTQEELEKIPETFRPVGPVKRNVIKVVQTYPFLEMLNKKAFIFDKEEPRYNNNDNNHELKENIYVDKTVECPDTNLQE